jgi:aminoglycoside phosphotransferase (APT) family kinase protein
VDLVSSRMLTNDTLRSLLRDALGSGVEIASSSILNRRDDYLVLRVELTRPAQAVIVKLAGPGAPYACPFDRTAAVHELVRRQTTVPLAEIVGVDVSYARWPWRYLISTAVSGEEWATVRQTLDVGATAAAQREIGEIDVERDVGVGAVDAAGAESPGPGHGWYDALAARARQTIGDPTLRDLFLSILAERAGLLADVDGPALTHDDLHHHNILFRHDGERWRLAALLDFDKAWAADPESDLARLDLWRGMTGPDFCSAYRERRPLSDRYLERRPLYQLLWCLEYRRSSPEHIENTRAVCAALGLSAQLTEELVGQLGRNEE